MISTGTIPELSGRANAIDYFSHDSWGNYNWPENSERHNQSAHGGTFIGGIESTLAFTMHLATLTAIRSTTVHGK